MASIRVMAAAGGAALLVASAVAATAARETVIAVPGIPGPYCAYGAEKRLLELHGVEDVQLLWASEQIRVITSDSARITADLIRQAMKRADYPYKYEIRTGN